MICVVTGAASGIGRRLVTLLAESGHTVLAADVDQPRLAQAAAECRWPAERVRLVTLDVTSGDSWQNLLAVVAQQPRPLDVLINVAGVLRVESVWQLSPDSVALQLDVNAKGVILGTQAAASVMVPNQQGHIINIASMAALAPVPGIAVYSASKFAVRGFSLAAAQELEPHGVCVSVVCPDAVDTPMVDYQLDFPAAALTFSGPRILTTDEVARAVVGLVYGKPRLELVIPWSRGVLAKASMMLPRGMVRWISRGLTRKGLARQQRIRQGRGDA
jgi:NAD(P)-dependent dehydrogenase (short-subunit alcohol dehydrogenase family)